MSTVFELKEQAVTDTPLLVFDCVLSDGRTERWSTHAITVNGDRYEARVLQHNVFEIQSSSDQGVDGIPRISLVLANADSHFSEIERASGWKGARLTVAFLFYDLRAGTSLTGPSVLFQGICNPPDEIRESTFRVTAANRMNLQRLLLPQVRIQRRCPWDFPATAGQRLEAHDGGAQGKYSRFFRCGYSADVEGGEGASPGGVAFAACGYTRSDCEVRGMFSHFGGIEFVPPVISVRSYGEKNWQQSAVAVNQARYNDFVPVLYGTGWYTPPVVFARNDGNLTRMEVLLGLGEIQGVVKVLVNDAEIPAGVEGANMTGTGWYKILNSGGRVGTCNPDFTDGAGLPAGDPYGSMAYMAVVVPNRLNDGTALPKVKVLVEGLKLRTYGTDGTYGGETFTNNPAWVLLDMLRKTGWTEGEIDLGSFASAASYCGELIDALDIYANPIQLPRFGCNLLLQNRRSAGDLIRGIRNAARLLLTYGPGGVLRLMVENTMALERPSKPDWSNSQEPVNGGWPSYEFGDGSNGYSGMLRRSNGEPSVRVFTRSIADSPNRFSVEFQDALNEYQQDSFSLVDADDAALSGQEVSSSLSAIGLANFDQAARILKLRLDKSIRGNTYIEFDTSVKCFGVSAGDLITVTYLKEGFNRQLFRILKLAPGVNHRITTITAQVHDDAWYWDSNGQANSASGARRQGNAGLGVPRPLIGTVLDEEGEAQFGIAEAGGGESVTLSVSFVPPATASASGPAIPLLNLAPQVSGGGTLEAGQTLYYAVAGCDDAGNESALSFIVRAGIEDSGGSVALNGLSFGPGTTGFHVYRGVTPAQLFRIAANQTCSSHFTDTGLDKELVAAPDPNFDHANFYWRIELQPESQATIASTVTVGDPTLEMPLNRYSGMTARITRGRGAGQERTVLGNTETTLTVSPPWHVQPDETSYWVVAENGWHFGALTKTSPVQFDVPNRAGATVQVCGRSANVNDVECAAELSTVTRWQIDGEGGGTDANVPPKPYFGLNAMPRGGGVELSGVSFTNLENTRTISSATLTLYYWNELIPPGVISLAAAIDQDDTALSFSGPGTAAVGDYMQAGAEVMMVTEVNEDRTEYVVSRAMHKTESVPHSSGEQVRTLLVKPAIAPFPREFFGSSYSGSWSYPVLLPDARVVSAELFVTNSRGNSVVNDIRLTNNDDLGLRTLSGGQYSIQAPGYLAVDSLAAPVLVVESSHAVRDVSAILGTPADREVELQVNANDEPYCTLSIPAGFKESDAVDGHSLPPLVSGTKLTLSVVSVGLGSPGADLTVTIRL